MLGVLSASDDGPTSRPRRVPRVARPRRSQTVIPTTGSFILARHFNVGQYLGPRAKSWTWWRRVPALAHSKVGSLCGQSVASSRVGMSTLGQSRSARARRGEEGREQAAEQMDAADEVRALPGWARPSQLIHVLDDYAGTQSH
jgi:hypothetical protein